MSFIIAASTDKGVVKKVNQDSFSVKRANTSFGEATFAIMCDGMGGLASGEIASGSVVSMFSNWFNTFFSFPNDFDDNEIKTQWNAIAVSANETIKKYGNNSDCKLGTTLTAMLFLNNMYYCINVGDSRGYLLRDNELIQLTVDQSYIQREISQGRLTVEEAKTHPYRNVLLQCIGCDNNLVTDFYSGSYETNDLFLLCSDGFRHEIDGNEISDMLSGDYNADELTENIKSLIQLNISRGEKDNITCVVVKCVEGIENGHL